MKTGLFINIKNYLSFKISIDLWYKKYIIWCVKQNSQNTQTMKKCLSLLAIAAIVVMATLMLQGCNNNEATQADETTERIAEASERMAEALEEMVPRSITDRESGSTVGWSSLSLGERKEILEAVGVGSSQHYGDPVRPRPAIQEVTFVLYLVDVPSPSQDQTLIEYSYTDSSGKSGKNRFLVQGHLEIDAGRIPIGSIQYVLNSDNCCYLYGGCINGSNCSEQRPKSEKCEPCKAQPKKEEPCKPCQQQGTPGPSRRQGDGAAPSQTSNGRSRVLPPVDL